MDELQVVLGFHQQALSEGRFQRLEGVDQCPAPDGGKLGGRKGIAHAGAIFEQGYQFRRELLNLGAEQGHHRGGHAGLPDLVQVPAPLPVAVQEQEVFIMQVGQSSHSRTAGCLRSGC